MTNAERQKRYRESHKAVTQTVTESPRTVTHKAQTVTGTVTPLVRINSVTGMPYGKGMLGLLGTPKGPEALAEYERKHGQTEPVYREGNVNEWLATYAVSDKFRLIAQSMEKYADDVRVGCFGPTVRELADTCL